jgi:GT2 family glycosyltransferase
LCETAPDAEIVAIDNTGHYVLPDECPHVVLLPQSENIGCTAAKMLGVEKSHGDIVIFLDCDTVAQPGWLDALLAAFENPDVAMAGPRLIYPDGRLQCACIRTWHGNGSAGGENRLDEHASNDDEDGCTGACVAIRRSVYLAVGGIDPLYLNGYDDVSLSLLVKEAGHKIAYRAESVVVHHESSTGPERWTYAHQNVALMNQQWGSR